MSASLLRLAWSLRNGDAEGTDSVFPEGFYFIQVS